jgi:glutathione S-transferase
VDIYLHHYPASLFSEKIRLLLGWLGASWRSVETSSIMPRPLLMPLTGGYRKTPNLQIGANVYSDSSAIARGLARHFDNQQLYSGGFNAERVAEWADTQLFRVVVALNFRPESLAAMMGQLSQEEANAFMADRAQLSAGAAITTFSGAAAEAYFRHYLDRLETSLTDAFLFGNEPNVADFSLYHCVWFIDVNPANSKLLGGRPKVRAWLDRMLAFGHGDVSVATGEDALAHARANEPVDPGLGTALPAGFRRGDAVTVAAVDYGRNPIAGSLVAWTSDEIVIERSADEAGRLYNHFPSAGFEVVKA